MELLATVLGVLFALTLGACAWLAWKLSAARASAAAHRPELESLRARLQEEQAARAGAENALREAEARLANASAEAARLTERIASLESKHRVELESARDAASKYEQQLEARLKEMQEAFRAAINSSAAEALKKANEQFVTLAESKLDAKVKPIGDTLARTEAKLAEIERAREQSFGTLAEQARAVAEANNQLRRETANLVNALRKPQVRGRYGEIQLRRVVELAGMREYCDFTEQESARTDDGRLLRPDMLVKLPNGRVIAVDAKTNIEAYINAVEADGPEAAEAHLDRFARHVAEQARALADKGYAAQFTDAPELVVMFIPGDQFIDAALQRRPDLLDTAAQSGVILASPSTLIGLLRAVYIGWREKRLSDSAGELFKLGRELHERAATALGYASELGEAIDKAAEKYNKFAASVDSRLMPTLRKFEESGAKSQRELPEAKPVETATRPIASLPARTETPSGSDS